MKRVIVVYNARSSKAERVRMEVIGKFQKERGVMVGKYAILPTNVDDNSARLAKILADGDFVIAAGGDATATIMLNGAMLSGKKVKILALRYGNFNDMAMAFLGESGKKWYPLEVKIDGGHWRYVGSYFSVGMFAESTEIFNQKEGRKKLKKRNGGIVYSVLQLAKWYFKHKREDFLPDMKLNGEELSLKTTDYMAVNGKVVARIMRGENYGISRQEFLSGTWRLSSFFRLIGFMGKSMALKIPGKETRGDTIEFLRDKEICIQAEGESVRLFGVKRIEITRAERGIEIFEEK